MGRLRRLRGVLLPALLAAWSAGATAEEAVLLASTAPGYAPGGVLASGDRLSLPEGTSLTLLFRSGQMLRLRGPAETALEMPPPARREGIAAAFAEAFRLRGIDASVIGATRASSFGRPRPQPQDVAVEATRSGTWCIGPGDTVWLVRPPAADASRILLRRAGTQRSLAWPAGAARIEWPDDMAIEDGDRIELSMEERPAATLLFRRVAGGGDAAGLAEGVLLGCHEQYDAALRRLARGALPPELWLTTEQGRAPVLRGGTPLRLTAVAGSEGWLYCLTQRADGATQPVLPAAAAPQARVLASVPVALPGPRGGVSPVAGMPGTERLRCWLTERDIAAELPEALRQPARLDAAAAAELDAAIARIAGGRVASATLEWRVE
jgi:hypothetical protein